MRSEISNTENVLDSRDIIKRLEELESLREEAIEAAKEEASEDLEEDEEPKEIDPSTFAWDEKEEYEELKKFADECESEGAVDWTYGCTLIHTDYFTEYCEELVKDIGDLPAEIPQYLVIDWEKTAENLMTDYGTAEFDGQTYFFRNC